MCQADVTQAVIRLARTDEVQRLVEMGERFHRESSYKEHVTHNHEQMIALATQLVAAGNILVMECDGELVGMIGFMVLPHFLSGEVLGMEVFWWLEPEHRGEGRLLLKAAEDLARERGAKRMQMIAPNERVGILYKRIGYTFVESAYQKTL